MVQEYLNEISPTIYDPNKPKTSGKPVIIPDLQPPASYHDKPATLYIVMCIKHHCMVYVQKCIVFPIDWVLNKTKRKPSYLMRLTIHRSASSVDMLSFSASMEMEMHWWMRQNVSKIIRREFSMKSSRQATWNRAVNECSRSCQWPEKAPSAAFSLLKAQTSALKITKDTKHSACWL